MLYSSDRRRPVLLPLLVLVFIGLFPLQVFASVVDQGLSWLSGQQDSDGVYLNGDSVAAPPQSMAEAVLAQHLLSTDQVAIPFGISELLVDWADENTEFLSLHVHTLDLAGDDYSTQVAELLDRQNDDGGFADATGYSSTTLATTAALKVLHQTEAGAGEVVQPALGYLLDRQGSDGGWADGDSPSSVYTTALAVQSLTLYSGRYSLSSAIGSGTEYLLNQRQQGGGYASVWEGSHALLALIPALPDPGLYGSTLRWLADQQATTGNWEADVYSTALALQALHVAARLSDPDSDPDQPVPVEPTDGTVTGRILSAADDFPIADAQVSAPELAGIDASVTASGTFELTLPANQEYTLVYSADGFFQATQEVMVTAGGTLHAGTVRLAPMPAHGHLLGNVSDREDGSPVPFAVVHVTGEIDQVVSVDATGRYQLALPAGEYEVIVEAEDFHPATASFELSVGQALTFSPGLVSISETPDDEPGAIVGVIQDADTTAPLADVQVTVAGAGLSVTTGADGRFRLDELEAGTFDIAISRAGYHAASIALVLPPSTTAEVGVIALHQVSEPHDDEPGSIMGVVQDADTAEPLVDVQVTIADGGLSVITGADGRFHLNDLEAGTYEIALSRAGYHRASLTVTLPPSTTAEVGVIALPPVEEPGASRLTGTVTDAEGGGALAGATVTAAGRQTRTDSDGRFLIEGVEGQTFELRISAEGYVSREIPVEVAEPGTLRFSITLEPYRRAGLSISGFRADHGDYDAHAEAALAVDLENTGQQAQAVRLYLAVFDEVGNQLSEQPVMPVYADDDPHNHHHDVDHTHDLTAAQIQLEPGDQLTEQFSWFIEARPPGIYQLKVRAYEAFNGDLLGERTLPVRINVTRRIELVSVRPDPPYLTQGAREEVNFQLLVQQRSNVAFTSEVSFELLGPDQAVLFTGTVPLDLVPDRADELVELPGSVLLVEQAGEYPVRIKNVTGSEPLTTHGQPLFVAPGTRVEIRQDRTPGIIAPDGSYRIDLEIRLEGKEQ